MPDISNLRGDSLIHNDMDGMDRLEKVKAQSAKTRIFAK